MKNIKKLVLLVTAITIGFSVLNCSSDEKEDTKQVIDNGGDTGNTGGNGDGDTGGNGSWRWRYWW